MEAGRSDAQSRTWLGVRRFNLRHTYDTSIKQVDASLGVAREAWVVRHHADGRTFLVKLTQQIHHRVGV